MAVRVGVLNELPKRKKRVIPRILQTEEWKIALNKLAEGLKPMEYIALIFTPEELARYQYSSIKSAARPIKAHVRKYHLPYTVQGVHTDEGLTIRIMNDVARASKKAV